MGLFKNKYRINTTRIKGYDYSNPAWYYVTICTRGMKEWFGSVENRKMELSDQGRIASKLFEEIPLHFKNVKIDYYVVMPNHIHGIIILNVVETGHAPSLQMHTPSLGNVVGSFKSAVTKRIRKSGYKSFKWQPRFYDHIIRNEKDLYRIIKYIDLNPLKLSLGENEEYDL